jgi:hypothetical protein
MFGVSSRHYLSGFRSSDRRFSQGHTFSERVVDKRIPHAPLGNVFSSLSVDILDHYGGWKDKAYLDGV